MSRFLVVVFVITSFVIAPAAAQARTLHYWIGAVPETWNIVPSGRDPITGLTFAPEATTMNTVLYKRFVTNWRRQIVDRPKVGDNDGIPGPTIRARVGDTVLVHFRNFDPVNPHSMHFHGFHYEFESDGSFIPGISTPEANVPPGATATYRLVARRSSVGTWPYHDHSQTMEQSIGGGMYGAIVIRTRRATLPDRENLVFFAEHQGFSTVNGRAFIGNTPTFRARIGDDVEWHVLAIGSSHHTFHLHGHRWRAFGGENIDTRNVGPAESFRFRIREDVRGAWLYHCHVETHQVSGMIGLYRVAGSRSTAAASGSGSRTAVLAGRP